MLGDDIALALPELQAQAESMMQTRCRVLRIISIDTDPVTGLDTPVYGDPPVYEGDGNPGCKIQDRDLQVTPEQIPGGSVPVFRLEAQFPVAAGPFQVGDVVQTFAADDTAYATPVHVFRVSGLHRKTWQTAQRLPVEEL